jgi:hypothetical protein
VTDQLTLDLDQTADATSDFRTWLLSLPLTPWTEDDDG